MFEPLGDVSSVVLLRHEKTDRPIGVGVVEMPSADGLMPLANALVGVQIDGMDLNIGAPRAADRRQPTDRRGPSRDDTDRRQLMRRIGI